MTIKKTIGNAENIFGEEFIISYRDIYNKKYNNYYVFLKNLERESPTHSDATRLKAQRLSRWNYYLKKITYHSKIVFMTGLVIGIFYSL